MNGEDLTPNLIRAAYSQGCFPMGDEDGEVNWYRPRQRALLPIEGIRVSRSLARTLRRGRFEVRFDTAFEQVMHGCLRPEDNWITNEIVRVYTEIHVQGWGHSAEAWREGRLLGGVYGIAMGACFCAESMFHRETDASKVALHALVARCRSLGFLAVDAQIMNPHLASLGAFEVSHRAYMALLARALAIGSPWDRYVAST
ncbi:MAG: leucyl/phenylalanyl-tRNA--protein transferase [Fimbriimonas ginsengisoli]|uniref:Leucyl/phenylalanyl-tRNA--protein transferase n=1 Tax=Fimbriimonas ginsengisoli TaxID=1005039 RepID=A0A931LU49_FIMGI|nr:leucyl/phenylalanyl-tRNA--protein transferase [Fimbriimonas ginsengisoli]MBI3721014.1 leucyl/phenylalanyl-tRNA--protein transferase [Fimbriimonas ginsengisoli]